MYMLNVEEEDIETLKLIAESALFKSVDSPKDEKERLLPHIFTDIERGIKLGDNVYLKFVRSRIEGFILIKDCWNLSQLFVAPKFQSMGVGSALIKEALRRLSSQGNRGFVALNSSSNAVLFYQKHGFTLDSSREPKSKWSVPMKICF